MNEKSLAVESMHRLAKHIKDALSSGEPLSEEVFDVHLVWDLREVMPGPDLNACLAHLRSYKKPDGTPDWHRLAADNNGWQPKGRRGMTTK